MTEMIIIGLIVLGFVALLGSGSSRSIVETPVIYVVQAPEPHSFGCLPVIAVIIGGILLLTLIPPTTP